MATVNFVAITILTMAFVVQDTQACHNAYHGARKKRSVFSTTETGFETYDYNITSLIDYFTNCMTQTSNISFDWYSATEWTINESNWFYFTDNNDCASEGPDNETNCWLLNVDLFFEEVLQTDVKDCIKQFATDNDFSFDEETINISGTKRKKRNANDSTRKPRDQPPPNGSPPNTMNPQKPPRPPRNTECPSIPPEYNTELQRMLPPELLVPQDGHLFNITNVITFVDTYTICTECERYSGEPVVDCYANRLDQLTRSDSRIKQAIQVTNARYANGGDTVGNCRGISIYRTEWFDIDNPNTGEGDEETLREIRREFPNQVCKKPVGIQAQLSDTMKPYGRGNDTLSISPKNGLICLNADQESRQCQNYRVRFCCEDFVGRCPLRFGWTPFYDESDPRNLGEFELLPTIRLANPGSICSNPAAIGARLTSNLAYELTGDLLMIDPEMGLRCVTSAQPDQECGDYKVRFCCPPIIGRCSPDHSWTKWYNSKPTEEGDDETVARLRRLNEWECSGEPPSAIEAQEARSRRPYVETENRLKKIDPRRGLLCRNSAQNLGTKCKDYRVRFCCRPNRRNRSRGRIVHGENFRRGI